MAKLPTSIRTQVKSLKVTADEIRNRAFLNAHETWAMLIKRAAETIEAQALLIAELQQALDAEKSVTDWQERQARKHAIDLDEEMADITGLSKD